jgi:hypothetical protein
MTMPDTRTDLADLPNDPTTDAIVARVTSEPGKAPAFAVGAFNSYI